MINISGMDKAEVLKALYDHSHIQGMGFLQAVPEGYVTVDHCRLLLEQTTYFDYLYGKVLKVDLSGDSFDERLYDRDCGPGAAQRAIDSISKEKKSDTCMYFSLALSHDFLVNVDGLQNLVRFRVKGTDALDRLIYAAQKAREELTK